MVQYLSNRISGTDGEKQYCRKKRAGMVEARTDRKQALRSHYLLRGLKLSANRGGTAGYNVLVLGLYVRDVYDFLFYGGNFYVNGRCSIVSETQRICFPGL